MPGLRRAVAVGTAACAVSAAGLALSGGPGGGAGAGSLEAASAQTAAPSPSTTAGATTVGRFTPEVGLRIEGVNVLRVVDGDTFHGALGDGSTWTVRLAAIDAPEAGDCGGPEAKAALAELLGRRTVTLELGDRRAVDRFGRLLAYVFRPDGVFVNLAMIEGGWAAERYYGDNDKHRAAYLEAQQSARELRGGTPPASSCPATPPAAEDVHYPNCAAARAAGAAPLRQGEPGYRPALDRDGDGVACE